MVVLRSVTPELLDELPPDDPRAVHSRNDLRRIHRVMRSVSILRSAALQLNLLKSPRRIIELGAGDGTLMLRLARALHPNWPAIDLTLLDRWDVVSPDTRAGFVRLGWNVTVLREDALVWAAKRDSSRYDLGVASLFLHHFDKPQLRLLLAALAEKADAFIACEPCRGRVALAGSWMVGLLGAKRVTRVDAVKSVEAGFTGRELTSSWPNPQGAWRIVEGFAWPFTHIGHDVFKT